MSKDAYTTIGWSVRWVVPRLVWERWLSPRDRYWLWGHDWRLRKRRRALREIVGILDSLGGGDAE